MAEGVLVLGVGRGTKLLEGYLSGSKGYYGIGKLGEATDTLDAEGRVICESDFSHVSSEMLEQASLSFVGKIEQTPPMYSALKQNGVRLYDLARRGVEVDRPARQVTVHSLAIDSSPVLPLFGIRVECGGGVYIRSLIADIAIACGTCAHMIELTRTHQGRFNMDESLREVDWTVDIIRNNIIPYDDIVSSLADHGNSVQ
jgi:tRNA pseudouridine55 synthase